MATIAQSKPSADAVGFAAASFALLVARIWFASDFLLFGSRKFYDPSIIYKLIDAHHLPGELVYPTIVLQIGCGFLVLIGLQTRFAAAMLAWFCIVAPSIFWSDHLEHLSRDYAAAGGFLLLVLFGPGVLSLDARWRVRDWIAGLVPAVVTNTTLIERVMATARVLIAFPFLGDVVKKVLFLGPQTALYAQAGLSADIMYAVMLIESALGIAVLVGWHTRMATAVLVLLTVCLAFALRNPGYDVAVFDPGVMLKNFLNRNAATFFKDVTTIGALLTLWAYGPGRLSLDARNGRLG